MRPTLRSPSPLLPAGRMWLVLRIGIALCFSASPILAEERGSFREPHPDREKLEPSEWTLHPFERERTANALAAYVVNELWPSADPDKAIWAARLLGLALAMHRENPRAMVTSRLLRSGEELKPIAMEFSPGVFARILYNRSVQLRGGTDADRVLAGYLMAVATRMDPYFEDAVYEHELARFEGRAPDWSLVTGEEDTAGKKARGKER